MDPFKHANKKVIFYSWTACGILLIISNTIAKDSPFRSILDILTICAFIPFGYQCMKGYRGTMRDSSNKRTLKKMLTSKIYWVGVLLALTGFIMLGYHGYKHNEIFIPGLILFLIGFAIHGYNTIRAMTMMRKNPNT